MFSNENQVHESLIKTRSPTKKSRTIKTDTDNHKRKRMSYTIWARRICLAVFFLLFLASSIFAFFQRGPMPATGQRWRILGTSCPKDAEIYNASTDLQARFAVNTSLTAEEWRTLRPTAATESVPTTACILANGYAYGPGDGQRGAGIYSLYRFNLFFFATPRSSQTYSSFQTSMFEACPADKVEERHSAVIQQSWNLGTFYAAPLMQDKMLVNTWEMLIIIFSVSMVCECLRLRKSSPEDVGMRALRWVEYALTSPFILVIIAIAGYIRDQRLCCCFLLGSLPLSRTVCTGGRVGARICTKPTLEKVDALCLFVYRSMDSHACCSGLSWHKRRCTISLPHCHARGGGSPIHPRIHPRIMRRCARRLRFCFISSWSCFRCLA